MRLRVHCCVVKYRGKWGKSVALPTFEIDADLLGIPLEGRTSGDNVPAPHGGQIHRIVSRIVDPLEQADEVHLAVAVV